MPAKQELLPLQQIKLFSSINVQWQHKQFVHYLIDQSIHSWHSKQHETYFYLKNKKILKIIHIAVGTFIPTIRLEEWEKWNIYLQHRHYKHVGDAIKYT